MALVQRAALGNPTRAPSLPPRPTSCRRPPRRRVGAVPPARWPRAARLERRAAEGPLPYAARPPSEQGAPVLLELQVRALARAARAWLLPLSLCAERLGASRPATRPPPARPRPARAATARATTFTGRTAWRPMRPRAGAFGGVHTLCVLRDVGALLRTHAGGMACLPRCAPLAWPGLTPTHLRTRVYHGIGFYA